MSQGFHVPSETMLVRAFGISFGMTLAKSGTATSANSRSEPEAKVKPSSWKRFSLRSFFLAITFACITLGLRANHVRVQRDAIDNIERLGGTVYFGSQCDKDGRHLRGPARLPWNPFRGTLDDGWFNSVVNVQMRYIEEPARLRGAKNAPSDVIHHIAKLSELRWLRLSFTDVTNDDLVALSNLKKLDTLMLQSTRIHEGDLEGLRSLNLKWLSLERTRLNDEGLKSLEKIKSLTHLNLTRTKVSDDGLKHMVALPNLKALTIKRTLVTAEGYKSIERRMPNCKIRWEPLVRR